MAAQYVSPFLTLAVEVHFLRDDVEDQSSVASGSDV